MRVIAQERNEWLLVRRSMRAHEREDQLCHRGLRVIPKPKKNDDHVEVAERHQLCEPLGVCPFIQPWRSAEALAKLVFLKVVDVKNRRQLFRFWLPHLGWRGPSEHHGHFLVEIQKILNEAQQAHITPHRLQVLLVNDENPIAREIRRLPTTILALAAPTGCVA